MPFSTVFNLIGKALRSATKRPLQRFNIYNRSKKYIGEDSKHFFPAPRAIGPVSKIGPSQYPHLEGGGGFKSVNQRRVEAIASRNKKLLEAGQQHDGDTNTTVSKSFSELKQDDTLVIEGSQKLPVIKTITRIGSRSDQLATTLAEKGEENSPNKLTRPLPKSTSLDMRDQTAIWVVDKVPPGRLDLNKLQELMINKLADDTYWTPKQIAETYNIKEQYAENLISYLRQIRVVISPRMAKILDYTNRTNEAYNATKHVIYVIDKSLRTDLDKSADETFLPEDELDDSIRELLNAGALQKKVDVEDLRKLYDLKRPEPLKIEPANVSRSTASQLKSLPRLEGPKSERSQRAPNKAEKNNEEKS